MTRDIKTMCKSLRLAYVADVYESIPFETKEQFLKELFEKEFALREEARADRLMKKAKFLHVKELDDYHWGSHLHFPQQLDKDELISLSFIKRVENVILTGAPGTGKTHLATALGREACRNGFEVRFFRVSDLVDQLDRAWQDGKLRNFRNKFKAVDLIVLDEMGYIPFGKG